MFVCVEEFVARVGSSCISALEQMAHHSRPRLAVINLNREVQGILTQSMVISILDQYRDKLGPIKNKTVKEMKVYLQPYLHTIKQTEMVANAFVTLTTKRITVKTNEHKYVFIVLFPPILISILCVVFD
jgi:CBS-domain-containing membrane protein